MHRQRFVVDPEEDSPMNFDLLDLVIIVIGAAIGVVAVVILRYRVEPGEKKIYKRYGAFLVMGGIWFIVGLVIGPISRGSSIVDTSLLTLGMILLLAGGIGVIAEYLTARESR
jgi:hypothetical protein